MQRSGVHNKLGETGETLAAEFLITEGYTILERNLVFKVGEIDILAQDGEVIVIVEVKTRTSATFIDPVYALSPVKMRKLRLLGEVISARNPNKNIRIDGVIVAIEGGKPRIELFKNIS